MFKQSRRCHYARTTNVPPTASKQAVHHGDPFLGSRISRWLGLCAILSRNFNRLDSCFAFKG